MTTLPELQQFLVALEPLIINLDAANTNLRTIFSNAKQMVFDPNYGPSINVDQFIQIQSVLYNAAGQQLAGTVQTLGFIPPK